MHGLIRILSLFLLFAVGVSAEPLPFEVQEKIVYTSPGGIDVHLDAYIPHGDGPFPAIVVIHGGAWKRGNRKALRRYAEALTPKGFACFAIDYRLAPKHKFPAQIDDCRSAVVWIREHAANYKVKPEKIGAIGFSAGGHLTSLLATTGEKGEKDTRIQAAAAGGAPTEFRYMPIDNGRWAKYWMGGDLSQVPENFHAASSAAFADAKDAPTFFYNGTKDTTVPLTWTLPCFKALKDAGVRTELFKVEGAGHGKTSSDSEAVAKAFEFLESELKN